ncbi:hypothetical protein PG995_009789 [Apiospora arundinis]
MRNASSRRVRRHKLQRLEGPNLRAVSKGFEFVQRNRRILMLAPDHDRRAFRRRSHGGGLRGWGLYSPGISCPAGHRIACRQTAGGGDGGGDDFPFQFSPTAGETAAGCCPSSYSCSWDIRNRVQTCVRTETTGTYTLVNCGGSTDPGTTVTVQTVTGGVYQVIAAPLIQINWRAVDIPPTATPGSTSQSIQPTGANSPAESSGLSTGAQAGIGVGAALAGLLLLGGVIGYMVLQRRKRRERGGEAGGGQPVLREKGTNWTAKIYTRSAGMFKNRWCLTSCQLKATQVDTRTPHTHDGEHGTEAYGMREKGYPVWTSGKP